MSGTEALPTTMVTALNRALHDAMDLDERVLVFGEDVSRLGGVFRVTDGLRDRFGPSRCFDTPLAESGIIGMAVGLAMRGFRPVAELQFDGFTYPAFEQIISHVAKMHNRLRSAVTMPITIRVAAHGGVGAIEHHSESPETYFAHTAGLKVVTPATPADAYSLLRQSIDDDDPVVFLEPKRRYFATAALALPVVTEPLGRAVIRRPGTDATVVAYGPSVGVALESAEAAVADGIDVEVVDLRSLVPLDIDTVVDSVVRTGRCIVVHEAPRTLGMGAEVAALVQELAFDQLVAPVLRATGFDTPNPPPRLERFWLPDVDRVLDLVHLAMSYR